MSLSLQEAQNANRRRMEEKGLSGHVIREFLRRMEALYHGATGEIHWEDIGDLEQKDIIALDALPLPCDLIAQKNLAALVVIKLNGGLGTSMSLDKAKSLIPIRAKKNFLRLILEQVTSLRQQYQLAVPLLLMHSFRTRADCICEPGLADFNHNTRGAIAIDFLQNQIPRIYQNNLLPMSAQDIAAQAQECWCPPGHGDVFFALHSSGLLKKLLDHGYRTAFISNGDNLGAVVDVRILEYFHKEGLAWISEITPKSASDLKGGSLYRSKKSAKIELLEIAQVPEEHKSSFQDIRRFPYFNVNNLWLNLEALYNKIREGGLHMPLILNRKKIMNQDIIQLETAMGAAISCFEKSRMILVPRGRFAPVKNCADLLLRRSDAYAIDPQNHALVPAFTGEEPLISLSEDYQSLEAFEALFSHLPSLKKAKSFAVQGKLHFDVEGLTIAGDVRFQAQGMREQRLSQLGRRHFQDEKLSL